MLDIRKRHIQKILQQLEAELNTDVVSLTWPIWPMLKNHIRYFISSLAEEDKHDKKISIILTTTGWSAEISEEVVNVLRHHYDHITFIVPDYAMSAGTILCMSWDSIMMDYQSSLWPIDPQVPSEDNREYIPWWWYLKKIEDLISKEREWWKLTESELNVVVKSDIGRLFAINQNIELTNALLKNWLVKYKFKNWMTHEWSIDIKKKWQPVTDDDKVERAEAIAKELNDIEKWKTHWRPITMNTLVNEIWLKIDDFWESEDLKLLVYDYYDMLKTMVTDSKVNFFHSRLFI